MGKDPAFLFYDGDAARDVSHMNRLERGCYFDLIQAQKKFGPLTLPAIKKILGKDFDECWPSLVMCLTYVEDMYFIAWLKDSIERRQKYSEGRSKNRKGSKQPKNKETEATYVRHMENATVIENEIDNNNESINFFEPDTPGDSIVLPFETDPMRTLWAAWKRARWENHQVRYKMHGEQADLRRLQGMDFRQIESTIQQAIAGNWKNLYPEKHGKGNNGKGKSGITAEGTRDRLNSYTD